MGRTVADTTPRFLSTVLRQRTAVSVRHSTVVAALVLASTIIIYYALGHDSCKILMQCVCVQGKADTHTSRSGSASTSGMLPHHACEVRGIGVSVCTPRPPRCGVLINRDRERRTGSESTSAPGPSGMARRRAP